MAELENSLTKMDWLSKLSVGSISSTHDPNSSLSGSLSIRKNCIRDESTEENEFPDNVKFRNSKEIKPPYSYANMITFAINSSAKNKMTLSEIYKWICENFKFYKDAGNGWKNSIRHNLSLNKCFMKVPRSKDDPGKGSYWCISKHVVDDSIPMRYRKRKPSEMKQDSSSPTFEDEKLFSPSSSMSSHSSSNISNIQIGSLPYSNQSPIDSTLNENIPCPLSSSSNPVLNNFSSSTIFANHISHFDSPNESMELGLSSVDLGASFKALYNRLYHDSNQIDSSMHNLLLAAQFSDELQMQQQQQQQQQQYSSHIAPESMPQLSSAPFYQYNNYLTQSQINHVIDLTSKDIDSRDVNHLSVGSSSTLDLLGNFTNLKENLRVAASTDWQNLELSSIPSDLMESVRASEQPNWSLRPDQLCDLASSLNSFLIQAAQATSNNCKDPYSVGLMLPAISESMVTSAQHKSSDSECFTTAPTHYRSASSGSATSSIPLPSFYDTAELVSSISSQNLSSASPQPLNSPQENALAYQYQEFSPSSEAPNANPDVVFRVGLHDDIEDDFNWDTIM